MKPPTELNPRLQRSMVYCGHILVLMIAVGMLVCGFVPPPSPDDSAEQISAMYDNDQWRILGGCALMMASWTLWVPWAAQLAMWVRRTEPGYPSLTYCMIVFAAFGLVIFEFIVFFWAVAAFRPGEVDPDVTLTLNDIAWFMFLYTWPPFSVQMIVLAVAIFRDRSRQPIFPRWLGYLSVWSAVGLAPAVLMSFFKHGAFGFNGAIGMWLPLIIFCFWMVVVSVEMVKAINREQHRLGNPAAEPPLTGRADRQPVLEYS